MVPRAGRGPGAGARGRIGWRRARRSPFDVEGRQNPSCRGQRAGPSACSPWPPEQLLLLALLVVGGSNLVCWRSAGKLSDGRCLGARSSPKCPPQNALPKMPSPKCPPQNAIIPSQNTPTEADLQLPTPLTLSCLQKRYQGEEGEENALFSWKLP